MKTIKQKQNLSLILLFLLLTFIPLIYSLDKVHKKTIDQYKKNYQANNEQSNEIGEYEGEDDLEVREICTIIDKCRTCNFKELQQMQECQSTGYRLIKRCEKKSVGLNEVIEDIFKNEECTVFNGKYDDYQKDSNLQNKFAEPGSQPYSVFKFMIIMGILGGTTIYILNQRKERILNEIYSKISIVNR